MKQRNIIIVVLFLMVFSSCKYDEEEMHENKSIFKSRQGKFEELIALIKKLRTENKLPQNTFITQEAEPTLKPKLEELNIISVEIEQSDCKIAEEIEVSFDIDGTWFSPWYTPGKFQISYVPCNHQTVEGFEYYDGYHRNIYGLGNHWMIYSDTDLF